MPQLSDSISPEVLSSQEDYEQSRQVESDRLLLNYVKQWWKDYLGIRPSHATRQVKLFAKDENGDSHLVMLILQLNHVFFSPSNPCLQFACQTIGV